PVITDSTGSFSISVPNGDVYILLSPSGYYKNKRVYLNRRYMIETTLNPLDINDGQDPATHIFYNQKKDDFASSASFPDTDMFRKLPDQTTESFFKGSVPGMWSTGMSGMPGSGAISFVRGIKSMNGNSQPLYVIDGLPLELPNVMQSLLDGYSYNPLSGLNPADITDVTIVKDYLNAPIYGMRGSNGIVFIQTLKPTEVETTIDVSVKTGFSTSPNQLPQLNADQYRTYAKEILMTSPSPEETFRDNYPGLYATEGDDLYQMYRHNSNWQNQVFKNALLYDLYFRILGGDEIARYGLSVGYLNNQGILDQTNFDRFSVRFVGSFNMFQWLRFNISSSLSNNSSSLKESARISQTSPILASLAKNPLMIPYRFDEEGNQLLALQDVEELGVSNPVAIMQGFEANNRNNRFLTNFRIEADINRSLKFNSLIGINFNSLNEDIFMPNLGMELYYNDEAYNAAKSLSNYFFGFSADNYLNYLKVINNLHHIRLNMGVRINSNRFQSDWGIAKNSHESDEYRTLQSGTSNLREMGGSNGKWNRMALYSNFIYSYKERYLVNLSVSGENSTRIGPAADNVTFISDVPIGLFYAAGASWRISKEVFLKDIAFIEDLKLRINYGKTGNDDIGNYDAFNYFYLTHYRNTTGAAPGPVSDQSLSFEENYQLSTGLDFVSRGNRLAASFDLFRHRTDNLLLQFIQPFYLGHEFLPINSGSMENVGWEAQLSSRIVQSNRFSWDIWMNINHFTNRVLEIEEGTVITPFEGGEYLSTVGQPLLTFYGYEYEGVYATSGEAIDAGIATKDNLNYGAGDAIYRDHSGPEGLPDHIIDEYDRTMIGSPIPDYYGGMGSRIKYGNWSVEFGLQWVVGNEVFNYLRYQNEKMNNLSNQSTAVLNRWSYEGQETNVPRAAWDDPYYNSAFSSRWIEDGSYLKLKNLTLGYRIPNQFLLFRNAEVFATGTNLLTLSRYLGYDPEFSFSYRTMEQGIDYGRTPFSRTFMVGIKLGL
ncbi:MAG: hypothetical protein DRI70_07295, partial [Bacteroidetes bacterium]